MNASCSELQAVRARAAKLEKQNRVLAWTAGLSMLFALGIFLGVVWGGLGRASGDVNPEPLSASEIMPATGILPPDERWREPLPVGQVVISDQAGKVRVVLHALENPAMVHWLPGLGGRAALHIVGEMAGLKIVDEKGEVIVPEPTQPARDFE